MNGIVLQTWRKEALTQTVGRRKVAASGFAEGLAHPLDLPHLHLLISVSIPASMLVGHAQPMRTGPASLLRALRCVPLLGAAL